MRVVEIMANRDSKNTVHLQLSWSLKLSAPPSLVWWMSPRKKNNLSSMVVDTQSPCTDFAQIK